MTKLAAAVFALLLVGGLIASTFIVRAPYRAPREHDQVVQFQLLCPEKFGPPGGPYADRSCLTSKPVP